MNEDEIKSIIQEYLAKNWPEFVKYAIWAGIDEEEAESEDLDLLVADILDQPL
jgi:hypothetical protein